MKNYTYPQAVENLPVTGRLDSICEELKAFKSRCMVLTADTGSGKSTVLPLGLLNHFEGKILMLEPRRLAVLNIAGRVSQLLGEKPGETCGYSVHLENRVSDKSRFIVLTEAILTRRLQNDPELSDVSVVVLDEFHERSIHADLALAFLKDAMQLRDDLYVVVMSATMQTDFISEYLGNGDKDSVACVNVEGRRFPVQIEYDNNSELSRRVITEYINLEEIEGESKNGDRSSSVLVFLPGIYEINRLYNELSVTINPENIHILHSSVPIERQKEVFVPENKVRIILSSAIAETSVTVPDVKVVIDSGECRLNLYDSNTGLNRLVTRKVSLFNAKQRSGRAGRVCEGRCVRMWSEAEPLVECFPPEIERSDLTDLVLECYKWGVTSLDQLDWLTSPGAAAWDKAVELLQDLNCLKNGKVTLLGDICLALGLGVRLSCVAASGLFHHDLKFSTKVAVNFSSNNKWSEKMHQIQCLELEKRLQIFKQNSLKFESFPHKFKKFSTGCALLYGFPDRLGVKVENSRYQFASGKAAVLKNSTNTGTFPQFIIAVSANTGSGEGIIHEFEPLEEEIAQEFINSRVQIKEVSRFEGKKVVKVRQELFGRVVMKETRLPVSPEDYGQAVCNAVEAEGLEWLPLSQASRSLLLRARFFVEHGGAISGAAAADINPAELAKNGYRLEEALQKSVKNWLLPFITGTETTERCVYDALYYATGGDEINRNVPAELILENGKRRRLAYESQAGETIPVLEVIIQEIFGCFKTPEVMGVPVLLRLLSPARRPLQVTRDLAGFWNNSWQEIAKEMKGRYPKHNWDYRRSE